MEKNLEFLEKFYEVRNISGKVHLFHSISKIINRIGVITKLEKIYISKDYLAYLSEKIFSDKNKLSSFFTGNNSHVRLSLVEEFTKDFGKDIVKEIQEDFMDLKKYNSSIFSEVRTRLEKIMASEDKKIELEDLILFENYLKNWKNMENKIRNLIPVEFYEQKVSYFYTSLLSYVKFFEKYNQNYEIAIKFLEVKN
ncbi:hypothetical protein [Fusobacterium russii]|uniref:hypothetical protein n=1 Tax=Fusobacterium russii TaxID=854 RepID=UPI0003A3598B|nr:hypothetical protein [Fusobacterium russii]